MTIGDAVRLLSAAAAVLAGLAGCGWVATALKRAFSGQERAAQAAVAFTGAAKLMVDELQEEVHAAREETRRARRETEDLRALIAQERQLTDEKIARLISENQNLRQANGRLRARLGE